MAVIILESKEFQENFNHDNVFFLENFSRRYMFSTRMYLSSIVDVQPNVFATMI